MQHDRWSLGLLAREAVKNIFDIHARSYPLVILAVMIGVGTPLFSAWQAHQLVEQLGREQGQGRNLLSITAEDPNQPARIKVRSCNDLVGDADVMAAGVILPAGSKDFLQLGTSIPVLSASSTLLPALRDHSVLVGPYLSHAARAFSLIMPSGSVLDAARAATEPDQLGTNSAVVIGLGPSTTTSSNCYVELNPRADFSSVSNRLITEVRSKGGPLTATEQFSEPQSPIVVFRRRADQFLPILLGLLGGIAAGVLNRLRSGEWASYRMSGTSPRSLRVLIGFEQSTIAGIMVTVACLSDLLLGQRLISVQASVLFIVAAGAVWILVASILTIDQPRRKPTNLAKDR
jgi:hypothetical protein